MNISVLLFATSNQTTQKGKQTYFLATDLASESASWIPFLMVSVRTATCLG